jgi:hypothetical protein
VIAKYVERILAHGGGWTDGEARGGVPAGGRGKDEP